MRVRYKQIPFRQVFTITSYSSTALFIVLIFNNLLNLNTILLILLIIIAFRQNNILTVEIEKRLQNGIQI